MADETLTHSGPDRFSVPVMEHPAPAYSVPGNDGHELDAFLGRAFEEKPIWTTLYEGIRDVFFPVKLPPLQVTSKPIDVPDRMKVPRNPWAVGISSGLNIAILLIAIYFGITQAVKLVNKKFEATNIDVGVWAPKAPTQAGGGGGGGNHTVIDPTKGHLPKIVKDPITPPQVKTFDKPIIEAPAAINVQQDIKLPNNPMLPNIGVTQSANVTIAAEGQGSGAGMGSGSGGGLGSGNGNGFGPGTGGNAGGGVYHVGGGISAPVPLNSVEAEFSDEARRAKYQGVCLIQMIVDAHGMPQDPRVVRPLGMGLDQKALEAVRKYRFKPAMKDGRTPVPVMITVEVNFRLY
ncbi:MAG TPA: energy transducer TonB [Terracidiphilus sp.]|nr:energy transducer TonB [Terracidiphilus sp.]